MAKGEQEVNAQPVPLGDEPASLAAQIFPGKGEMARLIRAMDWGRTALGPVESWPQSLRTAVSICLGSRHPIVLWWGPERWMFYNDGYRPMLGASKHPQFLGAPGQGCWAEIWDIIGPMMERVIETGEATWSEDLLLLMFRYGYLEETYFTFSYSPILDEAGDPSGIFNACAESTARVLGERRMKTLRELTVEARTTSDAARGCAEILGRNPRDIPFALVYLLDATGEHLELAGQAGLEPGTPASPIRVPALETDAGGWPLARVLGHGRPEVLGDLGQRFDCLPREPWDEPSHQAMIVPIAHAGWQRPAGVLVLGISPRRYFDDEYRGFFGFLATQVATAVANARAYQAERERAEKLAELDRVKTAFFSNVSHEFRTPLTLILGPLEDALGDPAKTLRGEALEEVHRSALRLLKLVNSLLDFSRVEADRLKSSFEPTDLPLLTAGLAGAFKSLLENAGLALVIECPPIAEPIHVDPSQWEKIVLNLLSNAFKFTFEGEIAVRLQARDGEVELSVTDTGTGIPAEELPRVFDRFHRVEGARGRSFEGTGIGLALVKELVRQHGGSVSVKSAPGRGSTFVVTLPRGTDHLPKDRIMSGSRLATGATVTPYLLEASAWAGARSDLGEGGTSTGTRVAMTAPLPGGAARARILVAEDNPDMRRYLTRLLAPHWNVDAVADGQAAFESAVQRPPDLVLSDVMMPRMDGIALLRALRADPRTSRTTIMLLSARAGEEAVVTGLDTGADDYLAKPFSASELLARVRTHLEMSRLRGEWTLKLEAVNQELKRALGEAQTSREEALIASRAKSEFLAAMSHEIRTPLSAMLGFAALLGNRDLTDQQRELAEGIRTSGAQLIGIIDDILDFSKLQSGRLEISPAPFALRHTLQEALDFVAGKASEKGVDLSYVMGPEVPAGLDADESRVRQVLINYLSNAVKFTTKGEVVLQVRSSAPGADGRQEFHFSVRDTGMGIPAERMDRLFREFSQTDASVGGQFGGSGLGLAICRKLADLHGGRVWAESQEGVGSSFHFALPAVPHPEIEPPSAQSFGVAELLRPAVAIEREAKPEVASDRPALSILLAEDNAMNQKVAMILLERIGYSADVVSNGAEAVEALGRKPYDVILMDMRMPKLDGIQATQAIRARGSSLRQPCIIAMTANAMKGDREACLAAGMNDYISKPVEWKELANALERASLSTASAAGGSGPAPGGSGPE